jgi:hypothetical protein
VPHGSGPHARRQVSIILSACLLGAAGLAVAQGTVETQKGPPPAPNTLAPESAPPPTAPTGRPAIEAKPGKPALAPVPGTVDEHGRLVPGGQRMFGLRVPVLLTSVGVLVAIILAVAAMRRRSRSDRVLPARRGPP